jgi:hypothetical protein
MILLVMITISALASSSRQLFAFARDDGLPFSRWLGTVSVVSCVSRLSLRGENAGQPAIPRTGKCNRGDRRLRMHCVAH